MKLKSTLPFFTLLATAIFLINNSSGPGNIQDMDRTGSPLSSGACNVPGCHNDGAFDPSVSIELLKDNLAVDKYQPGVVYDMKVTITAGEGTPSTYGFQAVALTGPDNDNTGTWGTPPAGMQSLTLSNNRTYVEHSSPSTENSFEVEWVAPQAGTGDVSFYAAGNAVNGNGNSLGDGAVATELTVTEEEPNSITTGEALSDFTIFPNPVQEILHFRINSRFSGVFDLQIIDVQGKIVQVQSLSLHEGQNERNIDVSNLFNGLYLIHLIHEQEIVTHTMIKM